MKKVYSYLLIISGLMVFIACRKPYAPHVTASANSHLVVEGVINTGADSTIIHLTHTISLSSSANATPPPELNATVIVEGSNNTQYPLAETGNGYYIAVGLNLSASNQYRLKITTTGNKVYESDFVAVKNAPPIDSVTFNVQSNGLQINLNTHDPANNTRYYRWDYNETWIIHSKYQSILELQTAPVDSIVARPATNQAYTCWQSDRSSDIVLGSTAKLSNDVVVNSPISIIPSNSEKFTERYTILIKQYALTKEAYDYYDQLKKNTEGLGTIFDPQPTILTGNIHCTTDPSEQVIGYISAGSFSQKRIYINANQLPTGGQWIPNGPYSDCVLDTFYYNPPTNKALSVKDYLYSGSDTPIAPLYYPMAPSPYGYTGSSPICVDCTLRGSNKKPDFWIDEY